MKSADGLRSPIQRRAHFIRDFLPAQNLQLLFPLGSFLLLLGASRAWYLLRLPQEFDAFLRQQNYQIDPDAYQRFTHAYQTWVSIEESIAMAAVRFAFFASLVLWCVSLRKIVSKFVAWVFLPAGLALTIFPMFLIATTRRRNAFVDAWIAAAHVPPPTVRPWFPTLNLGFNLAVSGLMVLAAGLILVRRGTISLPLRFRATEIAEARPEETSSIARDVSTFVIVMAVWTFIAGWALLIPTLLGMKSFYWNDRSFFVIQWAPALANAVTAAGLAFFLWRAERVKALARLLRRQPLRDYALALGLPLAVVLFPRFLLGVAFKPYLEPDEWPELFLPHPLPWVLVAYVITFFEEFTVRGYLQTALEKHLSLKRSIFLTGLLWSLFLGFGIANSLPYGAFAQFPGVSLLVRFATLIIYSVPLGWLYARTQSIVATALLHGTIVIFHVGVGQNIHLNHPEFYWIELALWILIGWLLFRKYPLAGTADSPVVEPAPS